MDGETALRSGETCWRVENAGRAAVLLDSGAYFAAAIAALHRARHSILLLGWGFDPRTRLTPDAQGHEHGSDEIGVLLPRLAAIRPELDIRVLIWKSALPVSISQHFFPHRARWWFAGTRVKFELDATVPFGACHHQKVLVIDDAIAFCGGGDFGVDRWDSTRHLDLDLRRSMPGGARHAPRHEVMMLMDGDAALALGDLVRQRWADAGLKAPSPVEAVDRDLERHDPWPSVVAPHWRDVPIAIARTEPAWRRNAEVREIEALHLDNIRRARRDILSQTQQCTQSGSVNFRAVMHPDRVHDTFGQSPFPQAGRTQGGVIHPVRQRLGIHPGEPGGKPLLLLNALFGRRLHKDEVSHIVQKSGHICRIGVDIAKHRQVAGGLSDHLRMFPQILQGL